jgi:uncharacterized damage-inducible protein DinB
MTEESMPLMKVYEGWEGYQQSLVDAVASLTVEQLAWRPAPDQRSVGGLASHIVVGRIDWFNRMQAPGSAELVRQVAAAGSESAMAQEAGELVRWLNASWGMIETTLTQWTVADLQKTYRLGFQGQLYNITRQWTIWRILSHDIHHGGQLAIMLGIQGIAIPELGDLGGHLTMPSLAEL